jgi:hypothetical protein
VAARDFQRTRDSRDKLPDTTLDNPIEKGFCSIAVGGAQAGTLILSKKSIS